MKTMRLPQFLTAAQIRVAAGLYADHGMDAVAEIQAQVIEPNIAAINAKLGQENDPRYLAYAVVYVLSQVARSANVISWRRILGVPQTHPRGSEEDR
jgi:hypothetical protein